MKRLVGSSIAAIFLICAPAHAQWVKVPQANIPQTADGKPNLAADLKIENVPFQPWAKALFDERKDGAHSWEDNAAHCLPPGTPRINAAPFPWKLVQTPAYIASHTKDIDALMRSHEEALRKLDRRNYAAVLRAMIGHDIGPFDAVRAKMLVVVAEQDHMVNPAPAEEFARATKSELLVLTGDCGHLATACEKEKLIPAVARFLAEP